MTNQRQVGIALGSYIGDYRGTPYDSNGGWMRDKLAKNGYVEDLWPEGYPYSNVNYTKPEEQFACPEALFQPRTGGDGQWWDKPRWNMYPVNRRMYGLIRDEYNQGGDEQWVAPGGGSNYQLNRKTSYNWSMTWQYKWAERAERYYRINEIKGPSSVIMMHDGIWREHMWRSWTSWLSETDAAGSWFFQWHYGNFNATMYDLHVASIRPFDIGTDANRVHAGDYRYYIAPRVAMDANGSFISTPERP
jgi:hypothetical protein